MLALCCGYWGTEVRDPPLSSRCLATEGQRTTITQNAVVCFECGPREVCEPVLDEDKGWSNELFLGVKEGDIELGLASPQQLRSADSSSAHTEQQHPVLTCRPTSSLPVCTHVKSPGRPSLPQLP